MKVIFIFLLTITALTPRAQDADTCSQMIISGVVTDTSKETIAFASVIAYNTKQEQVAGTQADIEGAYTLRIDCKTTDSITLQARYWGYEDISTNPMRVAQGSFKKDFVMRSKLTGYDSVIIISCPMRLLNLDSSASKKPAPDKISFQQMAETVRCKPPIDAFGNFAPVSREEYMHRP